MNSILGLILIIKIEMSNSKMSFKEMAWTNKGMAWINKEMALNSNSKGMALNSNSKWMDLINREINSKIISHKDWINNPISLCLHCKERKFLSNFKDHLNKDMIKISTHRDVPTQRTESWWIQIKWHSAHQHTTSLMKMELLKRQSLSNQSLRKICQMAQTLFKWIKANLMKLPLNKR